ncbi:uncharacterized protein LOC133297289 [Gastrolobium bilobum]|uniref:uncharacterized protein LOC133297289 n=1 Tax=Gastrolobium bilobum TaxID=150636 RepID=UPI002AB09D3C|nr:uncharacterized protein LOC133297289 [Gastrolobium bilobum]
MSLCGESDSLLCQTFPVFLRKQALEWFTVLPVNSVDSWSDLSLRFIQQFAHCRPQPKTTHNLCGVRQKPREKVREYYERFQAEARQVKGLENQTYLLLYTTGLQPGGLADSLAKKGPATKEDLMERIRKYIDLEEFKSSQRKIEQGFREATFRVPGRPAGRGQFEERQPRVVGERFREAYRREFTPLNTSRAQILKEVMTTEMRNVPRPPPIRSSYAQADKTKWCEFHRGYGHLTNECFNLMNVIERLIKEGKLQKYVRRGEGEGCKEDKDRRLDRSHSPPGGRNKEANENQKVQASPSQVPVGHICTIAGGRARGGESGNARKKHLKMCMAISEKPRFKEERRKTGKHVVFEDLEDEILDLEHDDPLVISGLLANYQVDRMLVDPGSSVDIIFWDAFRRMDLDCDQLELWGADLLAFTGDKIKPLGYVPLRLTLGKAPTHKTVTLSFAVVDLGSAYNIILGRPFMKKFKIFLSIEQLAMKFMAKDDNVATVRADQVVAQSCYNMSL